MVKAAKSFIFLGIMLAVLIPLWGALIVISFAANNLGSF